MNTEPYQPRRPLNTIRHAIPDVERFPVHPAWFVYTDNIAFAKRKREAALNEAYRRRVSEEAYQRQADAIWAIFETETSAARIAYDIAMNSAIS